MYDEYTKEEFGLALKYKVLKREDIHEIADWAYSAHSGCLRSLDDPDDNFLDTVFTLGTMTWYPEPYPTYEELDKIADDLIAGKEVNI